jgi:hypothetical protein
MPDESRTGRGIPMRLATVSPVPSQHLSRTDEHPQTAQRCVVSDKQTDQSYSGQTITHYTSSSLSFISSLSASSFPLLSRLMAE